MQDIHSIGIGGGGRLFGGGGARRLRPQNHQQANGPQALKCPRCESLNTKFCYYNNYNTSQPRHFCKNCRRYWTKGGVLRNVPVGGGCRKKKRSKSKSSNKNRSSVRKSSNSQNSSSDSSSLTANTTAANTTAAVMVTAPITAAEALSGVNSTTYAPTLLQLPEASTGFLNPSFDPPLPENNIFHEIDALTSLITSSTAHLPLEFNLSAGISPFWLHHTGEQQWMLTDHTAGDDLKVPTEFSDLPDKTTDVGLGTEDWNNCTDQALFDLTGTVDQSYWNQTQWDQ
ncbi:hypothetical protein L1987_69506 [Smallanthus sonchifolius]|uniref:Uncharacterized protein n=1 Tax=Smallanthus sonchifolius TaxID=185202 RepID=A0ACB9B5M0_9ASTR|nr:hypothetical protein L1987_69506 [Smallanthus sonchifolius]